jgi:hypothetical protein
MNSGPQIICPAWCVGQHSPTSPIHYRHTGGVSVGTVEYAVELTQYSSNSVPVVSLTRHEPGNSELTDLSVEQATELHDALGRALELLGGAR